MNLITELIKKGTKPRPGITLGEVRSITIHWIGPFPKQAIRTPVSWWVEQDMEASAHFIVKGDDVLNCIPTDEVAWHCGNKEGNYSSIGIEVIPISESGEFSATTRQTLKALLKTLPTVELKRHYDWTKKDCPRFYTPVVNGGDNRWLDLIKELRDENNQNA